MRKIFSIAYRRLQYLFVTLACISLHASELQAADVIEHQLAQSSTSFDEDLASRIHRAEENLHPTLGRIVIDDRENGITQSTWIYVNSALSYYKKTKPLCIILELNTPGGEVYAAQRISDALKDLDTQYDIPVIAYINNWAISAGAMLAYSCRYIVIAKDASMGAAEPVFLGEKGEMQSASEKVNSALRSDFANRAKFFDRNPYIAEAMVDKDVILIERKGEIIKVDQEADIHKDGPHPDIVISPKGKLLTLNAEDLIRYHVANMMLPPKKLEPLTEKEMATGKYPVNKSALVEIPYFQKTLERIEIDTFEMNWQTKFLAFLSLPQVTSLLFMAMLICFYVEISASTFGFAGVIGLLALFFILLSSFALEAVHWLEPILLFFGFFLLMLELFFFPTLGALGVIGAIFVLIGLFGMMLPGLGSVAFNGDTLNAAGEFVLSRLGWIAGALLAGFLIILLLSRFMTPKIRLMKRLVLGDTELLATGVHAMQAKEIVPQVVIRPGDSAVVAATLRPAGKILIHEQEVDALSSGGYIQKGTPVQVLRIEGEKIVVEELHV